MEYFESEAYVSRVFVAAYIEFFKLLSWGITSISLPNLCRFFWKKYNDHPQNYDICFEKNLRSSSISQISIWTFGLTLVSYPIHSIIEGYILRLVRKGRQRGDVKIEKVEKWDVTSYQN